MTKPTAAQTATGIVTARPSAYNMVDPRQIGRRPGFNPRFEFGEIEELAKSIKYQATQLAVPGGLLQAIIVKKSDEVAGKPLVLVDGDRRLTAVELLLELSDKGDPNGYDFPEGIPARLAPKDQTAIADLIQTFEAGQNKAFLPLEEAAAYLRMRESGMTVEEIGKAVQRAHMHIVSTLALLKADESLTEALKSGDVKGTMAKEIAVVARGDKAKQKELVADIKAAKGDKVALKKVKEKIAAQRVAKNEAKGKTLKVRPLTADQLSTIGAKLAKHLTVVLKEAKIDPDMSNDDLLAWVKADEARAAAYTFGALQALKAAAGTKGIELEA